MSNSLRNYQIRQKLGSGSYGVIYKAYNKIDKSLCVLKQISLTRMSEKARKNATNEAHIMGKLKHPFIVCYYQSFVQDNNLNILMEFCDSGDLSYYLKQQNKKFLKQQKIWKFFIQICMGLEHIHKNKILHRDIKTLNIFLNKNEFVKIGDLGVAKMLNAADFAHTMVGTPFYLSPQLCQQKPYNQKSDIWALGCLLYQLCTFRHPFQAANQASLILKIIRGKYEPIPEFYSKQLSQMISLCLERDYKRRPTTNMILSRPNIKKMMEDFQLNKIVNQFYNKNAGQPPQQPIPPSIPIVKNQIKVIQNKQKQPVKIQNKVISAQKPKKVLDQGILNPKPVKVLDQPKIQVKNQIKEQKKQKKVQLTQPQNIFAKKRQSQPAIRNIEKDQKKLLFGAQNKAQFISALQNKLKTSPKKNIQVEKREIIKKPGISFEIPWKGQNKKIPTESNNNQQQGKIVVHNKNALFSEPNLLPQKNSEVIHKIKVQKKVQPKVYEIIKANEKPGPIIKSGGFSQRPETGLERKKIQQDIRTEKKYIEPSKLSTQKNEQPKTQQKPVISSMKNIRKQSQQRPSYLPKKQTQPENQIPHYPPKLKKPSGYQQPTKSRPPKHVPHPTKSTSQSRFTDLTKQQQDLVANLPDIVKKQKNQSQQQQNKNKQKSQIKFKQIDDNYVAQMYQQMLKSGRSNTNTNMTHKKQQNNQQNDDFQHQAQYNEQQNIQQLIQQNSSLYNNNNNIPNQQIVQQQNLQQQQNNSNIYYQINKYQYDNQQNYPNNNSKTSPTHNNKKQNEWSFDQQPQLPMLQQTQTPLFEQANPYLVQQNEQNDNKTQQQIIKDKRQHLQIRLKQNIKRQDQINKLMQMKIQQCKSVVPKNFQEILAFFRSKINMDRQYTEQDQKQVQNFLAKRNLTDQRKFQNIYKIMHFEMELQNTRRIIQSICKKLSQLQK